MTEVFQPLVLLIVAVCVGGGAPVSPPFESLRAQLCASHSELPWATSSFVLFYHLFLVMLAACAAPLLWWFRFPWSCPFVWLDPNLIQPVKVGEKSKMSETKIVENCNMFLEP